MDPVIDREATGAEAARSETPRQKSARLRAFFTGRYERLEQLESLLQREPASPEAHRKLDLLRRAKFSTWLDLQALNDVNAKAA